VNHYTTYIDESGSTGPNLVDKSQPYFSLAAVTINNLQKNNIERRIRICFDGVKEEGELEIKAARWMKTRERAHILQSILTSLEKEDCDFCIVIIEKRFMLTSLIVNFFLDGAYNDIEDYTWCNNRIEMIRASEYFYSLLTDSDLEAIAPMFQKPTLDAASNAYQLLLGKVGDTRYHTMLQGFHLDEALVSPSDVHKDNSLHINNSPNHVAFSALVSKVADFCKLNNGDTDIIFDHSKISDVTYASICDLFDNMQHNDIIEQLLGLYPWRGIVSSFTVANSKNSFLLQAADILTTSIQKTFEQILQDKELSNYQQYIIELANRMNLANRIHWVTSSSIIQYI